MSANNQIFQIDEEIELEQGTVVRLHMPGSYTLEPGGTIDIDYSYELVKRGAMHPEEVALEVQDRVYHAMAPALARDPEVAAHVQARPKNLEASSTTAAPPRRLRN